MPTFLEPVLPKVPEAGAEEEWAPEVDDDDLRIRSAGPPTSRPAPRRAPAKRDGEPPTPTAAPSKAAAPDEATRSGRQTRSAAAAQARPASPPAWASLIADPGVGLEHVAVAMVRRLGPEANDWMTSARQRYPGASQAGLARLARDHFVRLGYQGGALAGAAGALGAAAGPALLAQARARLVLHIAAAYGADPVSDERVRELVALLRFSRFPEPPDTDTVDLSWVVATFALARVASRVMPFGAAAVGCLAAGRGTEAVAARAIQFYRDKPRESPPGP